jgi:hypothetical protein
LGEDIVLIFIHHPLELLLAQFALGWVLQQLLGHGHQCLDGASGYGIGHKVFGTGERDLPYGT